MSMRKNKWIGWCVLVFKDKQWGLWCCDSMSAEAPRSAQVLTRKVPPDAAALRSQLIRLCHRHRNAKRSAKAAVMSIFEVIYSAPMYLMFLFIGILVFFAIPGCLFCIYPHILNCANDHFEWAKRMGTDYLITIPFAVEEPLIPIRSTSMAFPV